MGPVQQNTTIDLWIKTQEALEKRPWESIFTSSDVFNAKLFGNTTFANKLFKEIDNIDWKIDDLKKAREVVKSLVTHQVAISKLLAEHGEKVFADCNIFLLLGLNKEWVGQNARMTPEEKAQRKLALQLAYSKRSGTAIPVEDLLNQIKECPLDLVHIVIQKPNNMPDIEYIDWLEEIIKLLKPAREHRHGEIQILIMNQIRIYEPIFQSQIEASNSQRIENLRGKLEVLNLIDDKGEEGLNLKDEKVVSPLKTLQEIEIYIKSKISSEQLLIKQLFFRDTSKDLAVDIYNALGNARIYDARLRNQVIDYVVDNRLDNKTSIPYAVAVAEQRNAKNVLLKISRVKSQLGFKNNDGENKTLSKILYTVLSNQRLRRGIVKHVLKNFKVPNKKSEILALADGYQNVPKMLEVMKSLDLKNAEYMEMIMSDVMDKLQSQYNLDPSLYGAVGRGYNYIMSYPIDLFFYVLDYLSYVCELVYSKYCSGTDVKNADTVAKDFITKYHNIKIDNNIINIEDSKLSNEVLLRDQLLNVLKKYRENPEISLEDLRNVVIELPQKDKGAIEKQFSENDFQNPKLQKEFSNLMACTEPKAFACAASNLLNHSSMKQGIDQFPTWSKVARGVAVFENFIK